MIKYNNSNINDWYYNTSDIIKVYRNGAVCYYKITSSGGTQTYDLCYAVVDDISQYQETEFEDVFNKADGKWYKLNNLNEYEEYGIYASGRTECSGETPSRLPQGYTEVEYIENPNNSLAYIDTGFKPNQDTRIVTRMQIVNSSSYGRFIGSGDYNATNAMQFDYETGYNGSLHVSWGNASNWTTYSSCVGDYDVHEYDWDKNYFYRDKGEINQFSASTTYSNFQCTNNLGIFAFIKNSTVNTDTKEHLYGKMYSFQMYDNGTLIRDLVPCKRDSDDMYGAYDIVNNVFYYPPNSSSYQFTGGSAVTPSQTCVTTYEGKLTIDDGYEYIYSGDSWVNVGEVSGSSQIIKSPEYVGNKSSTDGSINIGVVLKDNTKFQIKFEPTKAGGGIIFGEINPPSDNNDYRIFWASTTLYYDYGSGRINTSKSINTIYEYEVGNWYIKNLVDSSNVISGATKSGVAASHTRNIGLFLNSGDITSVYYMKVFEGDELIRDFIPWTDMNGNYGLFDKVSMQTFLPTASLSGSSNVTDVEVGGGVDYPIYYSEKSDPLDNLTFSSTTEAETYAYNNCVYDGMKALIDGDRYYFDSEDGWVLIPYYYKVEDVTPNAASGWTINGSSTYNPDSSYYDDFDLETSWTNHVTKIAKVTIYGYDHFTYYLRTSGYSTFCYAVATNVDEVSTPPSTMPYNSASAITNTYSWNKSPKSDVNLSNYRRVTYNNLDKTVEHTFYVYFYGRTYSSYVGNATILIPKEQTNENWEQVTFSASSNVASAQKNLYIDNNNSTSGGTSYWYYRWIVGLPSGSHSSYTNFSSYELCPNTTSSTFTSVAGEQRQVNFTYDGTTNKALSFRLTDGSNVLTPSDTVYYNMTYYNSCNVSSSYSNVTFPMTKIVKVGGRFRFANSSNRHYIYGYSPNISLNYDYYVDNYQSTFDITYTKLSEEAVTITYTTYDPNDSETPAFNTDITYPYNGGTTSSTTLTSFNVPYTYPYEVSQTSDMFSAASQSYTAGQSSRTISFTLYPNNMEFSTVADMEAYQYAWEGMKAKVGDTNYEYKNGEWTEITSKDSNFVIGDFNTFVSSSTEVTEGYYIIYNYIYDSSYVNKNCLFSWNSGNTWNGYYTLGNMNHRDVGTEVPISSSEIIDDAVWELKDAGNGNFYIRNVATNKYWYYLGTSTNYGVPLTDNAIPVNIQNWQNCLAFIEKYSGANHPINKLYNYSYRYGWYGNLGTDGNNQYYMRKYVP